MKQENGVGMHGTIVNIQHFSVDDGPGIRTTVFLKGCPLRCAWCHNPETHKASVELMYRSDKCRLCGGCQTACPNGLHRVVDGEHFFERGDCQVCGSCSKACVFGALELVGQKMTVEGVVSEILTDSHFCKLSGGGVTVSGGEPLAQADFTEALLKACKDEAMHTCVETCGYGDTESLLRISKSTDLFLFDYKVTDADVHKKYTGVSNDLILNNLDMLCQNGAEIILRCPMIPDVNIDVTHFDAEHFDAEHFDDARFGGMHFAAIVELANKYANIREIHLEPYHPLGVSKAAYLGKTVEYGRKEFLERSDLDSVRDYIQKKVGIPVKIS